jgi:hypothetical protein
MFVEKKKVIQVGSSTGITIKPNVDPFIKQGGFSREKIQSIIIDVKKIEGVKSFIVNPQNITPL